jgi:glutamyl/glutaminyl-tRNA synthetase
MTREEMVAAFTLDRVRSAPSQLDMTKLLWMNGEHLKRRGLDEMAAGLPGRDGAPGAVARRHRAGVFPRRGRLHGRAHQAVSAIWASRRRFSSPRNLRTTRRA